MYRTSDLKTGLLHLIGWRQNFNTSEFTIADSLTQTDSGMYFQEVHPLLTLENVKAIAPSFEDITYDTWDSGTSYATGTRVTYDSVNYRAKSANVNKQPDSNPTEWEVIDSFSLWLEEKTEGAIMSLVRTFYREKIAAKKARNLLESKALFQGAGRLADTIANSGYVVGLELNPANYKGVTVKLDKIGLQFTEAGDVPIYLVHSSRGDVVTTETFTRTREGGMEWFTPTTDIYLASEDDDNIDPGGTWYICYHQDDLPEGSLAVNKTRDWSKKPCGTCSATELAAYNIWSKYLEVHPFRVSGVDSPITMWDIQDNVYTYDRNYGINLQLTVMCDATDVILAQKESLADAIGLQVGVEILREFAYNPDAKVSRAALNLSQESILYALDGDSRGNRKESLTYKLEQAIEALHVDMTGLSKVCFPCGNKGLKYRTV